jgi:hypothetical protein
MALNTLARRQLAVALGSHHLAENIDTRWTAGGSDTLADSTVILQRLAKAGMGRKAATLFVANLAADSDVIPFTQTRLSYAMGPGGCGQAKEIDDGLG